MERTINMKLEERLEGAIGERGKFTGYTLNKKGLGLKVQPMNTNILIGRNIYQVKYILGYHQLR